MATGSGPLLSSFGEQYGEPLDVHDVGYLLLARTSEREQIEVTLEVSATAGCDARTLDADEAQSLQPGLRSDEETIYVFEPGAIYVDPMPVAQAMARVARRLGVEILEGCEVESIRVLGDAVEAVETTDGVWEAPPVMVATAAWGRAQLERLDVAVPVHPHRAEMAFFQVPPDGGHRCRCVLSDSLASLYLRPEHGEQMFVGWRESEAISGLTGLVAEDPDNYKQTADHQTVRRMHRQLSLTLPFMERGFVHRTYACIYDCTADEMPILDRAPNVTGLYFALGFSGGGFSFSPSVGRMMADMMVDGNKPADAEALRLSRFDEGDLISWGNVDPGSASETA